MRHGAVVLLALLAASATAQVRPAPPAALAAAARAAAPAAAPPSPPSPCAERPETGRIGIPGPDEVVAALPSPERGWRCAPDFRLDLTARLPRCVRPGVRVVDGSPRAACYAALAVGPITALSPRDRPTRSCPAPTASSIVALRGPGLGWRDVALTVPADADTTATTLTDAGPRVPESENPVIQGCFAPDCRLVRLVIGGRAPPMLGLSFAAPGGTPASTRIELRTWCPR